MIAEAHLEITYCAHGELVAVKISHSELATEGLPTIHADLADLGDPDEFPSSQADRKDNDG